MISNILGVFWILLGVVCLLKPHWLRDYVGRKTNRKFQWILYGLLFFLVLNLLGMVFRMEGFIYRIGGILGILILIRMILGVHSKAADHFLKWWSGLPIWIFRILGLVGLGMGISLIYF